MTPHQKTEVERMQARAARRRARRGEAPAVIEVEPEEAPPPKSPAQLYIESLEALNYAVSVGDFALARQALENLEAVAALLPWRRK